MAHSSWPQFSPFPSWHPETLGAAKRIACSARPYPPEAVSKQPLSRIYMDEYKLCVDKDEKI
jgi:hypothetical protein